MASKQGMTPIQRFFAGLTDVVERAATAVLPEAGFIYDFLERDRAFTAEAYPAYPDGGVWSGRTTPWIADIHAVPPTWRWTPADLAGLAARQIQIKLTDAYIQKNVADQTYSGTAAQQLAQRYTQGMWCPAVFPASQVETLVKNWVDSDAEFARQRLGGANPYIIAKYRGSAADLKALITRSAGAHDKDAVLATLTDALGRNALFVCDYRPILGGVAREKYVRAGQHFAVPLVFFQVEAEHPRLMPVAIQIDAPGEGYVFTPADDANAWLLAKIWAASADTQSWFGGMHIFRTHSIGSIFGVAALSAMQAGEIERHHPMLTLVYPHIQKVFDINQFIYDAQAYARGSKSFGIYQAGTSAPGFTDTMLPTGRIGIFQIINDLYAGYTFEGQAFDAEMKARGVDAQSLPVDFPFRDDAGVWWQAISAFVAEVVDATYADDEAVAADAALGAWMARICEAFNHDGAQRFTWRGTRAELAHHIANIVFLCTVQHAAVNDAQFDQSGFLPNGAYAMTAPPPTGPGVTDDALLASLPDPQAKTDGNYAMPIMGQVGVAMAGTSSVDAAAAGDGAPADLHAMYPYPDGSAQQAAVARFHAALWEGDDAVRARILANRKARIAACGVQPVPNSVAYPYLDVRLAPESHANAPVTRCIQV